MPFIDSDFVQGASVRHTLNTGKDLTEATVRRIYYSIPKLGGLGHEIGYWDETNGVTVLDNPSLPVRNSIMRVWQHALRPGINRVWTYAEWADGPVDICADPAVFIVTAPGQANHIRIPQ